MFKLILFMTALSLTHPLFAQVYQPLMIESENSEVDPVWSPELKNKFNRVRVKVFPHNSKYNSPHGVDVTKDKFTLASAGVCNVYRSESATSEGEFKRTNLIRSGKKLDFTLADVRTPQWIECSQPIELIRPDYATSSIRYQGLLFVKSVSPQILASGEKIAPYLTAVNVILFEEYLKGVVPSEMPASWSFEALKAQAIAARTYAYFELGTDVASRDNNIILEQSGAQIDDTVSYQAYMGLKNAAASTNKAVDETSGQVMTYQNRVIKAYFHADSGGYTENAENVWSVYKPYIIAKPEIYPEGSIPGTKWNVSMSFKDMNTRLQKQKLIKLEDEVTAVAIDSQDTFVSGRPRNVDLKLADGSWKKILAVDFAFACRIKSPWINFSELTASSVTINGRGFGHGAGMNQWGARVMVDKLGKKFDEILKFYYTDIEISR
jgi:SpoIID/LytB domain protein